MSDIITVSNLSKTFGDNKIIDNLSFAVPAGKVFTILGKNGAGKTTLIKMLLDILAADRGRFIIKENL
nr:ATP-binding cassette domain-containing protein [Lactococcus nasutitermitis]